MITPLHRMNYGIDRKTKDESWKSFIFQKHLIHEGRIFEFFETFSWMENGGGSGDHWMMVVLMEK